MLKEPAIGATGGKVLLLVLVALGCVSFGLFTAPGRSTATFRWCWAHAAFATGALDERTALRFRDRK